MKLNRLILAAVAALFVQSSYAQQPYGGCWHPDDIKNWSPETDKDAKFNRSRVPLAKRFKEPTLMKANKNQYYEGQICNAPILFPTCSMCPSQGAYNFLGYQPTYWQYMDKLVYWAGSASEGIIIPPPAGSIDAAHQSGVKVLGQVFFPPYAFGGNQAWVRQMLTKENGVHIYAKKLYEIAKYIGFDGWFINEESGGATSAEWADFIKDFNKFADENGDTQMEIQWYNARRAPDVEILKTHKNTSQFLEYGAAGDYRNYASQLGCTEEETFSKIYGGVQVAASGHTNFIYHLNAAMPTDGHVGSLDFFCPEEKTWKDNVRNLLGKNDTGPDAYNAINRTFEYEMQMWTNYEGDPSVIAEKWPGVSGRVLERSVINSMPFTTSFCVGVGKHRFVEGEVKASQDWYHSGVQSIMPTWRYWFENKGNGSIKIDWDDAWNFGSSLKVDGGYNFTKGDHLWRLYKTQFAVNGGTLRLVYKASANSSVEVKLSTTSSVNPDATLANPTTTTKNGWTIAEYDLSSLNGKTIYMIALNLKTSSVLNDYKFSLGELSVLPANYAPTAVEVKNLATTSVLGNVQGDARLTWDFDYTADFDHFDIYKENEDGTQTMVGQTRDEAFYVPTFQRKDNEAYVKFIVTPVMKDMRQQKGKSIVLDYPQATAPVVSFTISNSYLKVGESATITANGTGNPTAFKWTLPEGLKLANGFSLTDQTITVVAEKVGKQRVTVDVTNAIGTSTTSSNILDVMTEEEYKKIYNVVYQKKVLGYSGSTNYKEVPDKIIDGVTNPTSASDKWCNVSADNWVTFDLQSVYRIYSFKIFDGNAGPESGVDQIDSYQILLSEDNEHWTTVVDTYNRQKESVKTDYIAPMRARYVKLVPHVNGILRIWEFEIYGKKDNSMKLSTLTNNVTMNAGESYNINVTYDLGEGATKADKFECVATSKNGNVTIGTIKENVKKNTFVIPVTAKQRMGDDVVTIRVVNGDDYEEIAVQVEVDATTQPNVLKGKTAEVRHYENDYSFEAAFKKYDVSGLTDGNKADEALTDIEAPSTHRDDVWVIFTAPEGKQWNLSKVVVNIPNENYAENDNNEMNYVNKDVKIAVGDDLTRMNTAKTFSGLKKVSELSYIFPESVKTKYLAVICNLYVYSYPSMAEVSAYEQFADPTAINNATVQNAVKGIYTVNGTKLNALQKGLNIVKFADGTVQKVLVK
ncbi:endo-beta-N-acetylglucosaminidase [Leyella stercorea]|uniref:endo-beta-N-acetylglucosaminidase n=1 Tax=Leyella stercorea TaxID=363265 RepID=UPI002430BBC8|nr:discoidin domain-containing protein [Leyella stercorea]